MSETVFDPGRRQRYTFLERAPDGSFMRTRLQIEPGGDVPAHVHPSQEERFEVVSGEVRFTVGRERSTGRAGDVFVVPAGTAHAFVNDGPGAAEMIAEHRPALEMRELLEAMAALARAGGVSGKHVPRGPRALLQLAVTVEGFSDSVRAASPPWPLQHAVLGPLAALGRRLGYRREVVG
jgi:quercetin dioxygenase-like cupin family protein